MIWRSNRALSLLWDVARCDGCVAAYLQAPLHKANAAVHRWVRRGVAVRERARCPGCGAHRLVTRVIPAKFLSRDDT
jgi:hypothetical protein